MQQYIFLESKFLKLSDDMLFKRKALLLKMIQNYIDFPTFFVGESPIFLLSMFLESAIYQKFHRLHFLINLSENLDTDSYITMHIRKDIQNVPKELIFLQIAIL